MKTVVYGQTLLSDRRVCIASMFEEAELGEGDCVYFDGSVPHYGVCIGDKEVKCFMVIYTPE